MAALPLDEGELFAGRYRIIRCLASGGMGAVYEAVHTVTERRCALKVMLGHTVEREKLRRRFMQESKVAAQIGSDYIVDILDAGVDERTKSPYLVMELLEGEDLGQRIVRLGALSSEDAVLYLTHTALALDRTHRSGIVHRDLKASNLFLTQREDGTPLVKVLDFGVAKVIPLEATSEGHTQTVGTPIYMAPEQFRAEGRVSAATDIYALGMLAYTLLVGVHYWKEEHDRCENPFAFANIAVHGPGEPPTLRAARRGIHLPPAFDDWFGCATSRLPQDRFRSAFEAVLSLAAVLNVEPPVVSSFVYSSAPDPISSVSARSFSMPETLESPSARLSQFGRSSTAESDPVVTVHSDAEISSIPSFTDDNLARERTEVSLSVTNAGNLDLLRNPSAPKGSSRLLRAGVVAAVVVGAVVGARSLLTPHDPQAMPLSSARTPTEVASTPQGIAEHRGIAEGAPTAGDTDRPSMEVTSIDDLPTATDDMMPQAETGPVPTPPRRTRVNERRTVPIRQHLEEAAEPSNTLDEPAVELPAEPARREPLAPAASNRTRLYGRD